MINPILEGLAWKICRTHEMLAKKVKVSIRSAKGLVLDLCKGGI
jgi:hypothetical protein